MIIFLNFRSSCDALRFDQSCNVPHGIFDEQPSQSEVILTPATRYAHARLFCAIVMHTLSSPRRITALLSPPSQHCPPLPVNHASLPGEIVPVRRMQRFTGRWRLPSNTPPPASLLPLQKKKCCSGLVPAKMPSPAPSKPRGGRKRRTYVQPRTTHVHRPVDFEHANASEPRASVRLFAEKWRAEPTRCRKLACRRSAGGSTAMQTVQ